MLLVKMRFWKYLLVTFMLFTSVTGAAIADDDDVEEQGLYSKSNQVVILTQKNFVRKVYSQRHALVVQFYNSYCGHCRAFAPKYKNLADEISPWKSVIRLAVMDCSVEENNDVCRNYEVMAYPSLRYLHENYLKGNGNIGEKLQATDTAEKFKTQLIYKMQTEQAMGRLPYAPSLRIDSFSTYAAALRDVPSTIKYTFLIFENENSTVGSELALDVLDYIQVRVKRVYDSSELTMVAGLNVFPCLVAVRSNHDATLLTSKQPTKKSLLKAINTFLKSNNYIFPDRDIEHQENINNENYNGEGEGTSSDVVYYSDLEKTIKTSLHTEVTRHKKLSGETLQALLDYLMVLIVNFPHKGNLGNYLVDLHHNIASKSEWAGSDIYDLVKSLEAKNAPVYSTNLEYIGCKGSQPQYRGYTCGLWTLFHTLTVNAVNKKGLEGPKVLKAIYGYVKNFFGCSNCVEHFVAMAERNRLFDVKENDKAVLWLWISHNEVNLRLAGDVTEDPIHPKIQFPSPSLCPDCRQSRGAWNLGAVYQYLQNVYGAAHIQVSRGPRGPTVAASSPFTNLDIGLLSFLYILTFIILFLVIKYIFSKKNYRKRLYKHGMGKV